MNKIKIISLENCPYSIAAEDFFNKKNLKFILIKVNQETKNNYKKKLDTFPQIYLVNNNKEKLLGGFNKIQEINQNLFKVDVDSCMKYLNKNFSNFSRKDKLRLIQIFNN
jgi:glutaredoxin